MSSTAAGGGPFGVEQAEAATKVEVTLREPPGLPVGLGGKRPCGNAVASGIIRVPAPPPHLRLGQWVQILPAASRADDVRQLPVVHSPVNQCQCRPFGQRVMLEPGKEPSGQRVGGERATARVPVVELFPPFIQDSA